MKNLQIWDNEYTRIWQYTEVSMQKMILTIKQRCILKGHLHYKANQFTLYEKLTNTGLKGTPESLTVYRSLYAENGFDN